MGRPLKASRITPDVIEDMAAIGCTNDELVVLTGLSEDTLERRYADILRNGRARMRMSLRRKQVEMAIDGDRTMLIWLGKQYLGQRDKSEVTQETTVYVDDLTNKSDAELIAEAEALTRRAAAALHNDSGTPEARVRKDARKS